MIEESSLSNRSLGKGKASEKNEITGDSSAYVLSLPSSSLL
jgi:hypothetical protein